MTKKDFIAIAAGINTEQSQYPASSTEWNVIRDVALQLCIAFHGLNPRFDQKVFMEACGF